MDCDFCNEEAITSQQIFSQGSVRVLYPRSPVVAPSALIMPVRCVQHFFDLTDVEITDILGAARKLKIAFEEIYSTTGYNFFVNDGDVAGQHIDHVHFHLYGRTVSETESPLAILNDREKYAKRPRIIDDERRQRILQIQNVIVH